MKNTLAGITLFALTLASVVYYPKVVAKPMAPNAPVDVVQSQNPKIDVVFVLDTTGSMSGLIQTAKDKIWSIATTMASAEQTPEIRIGLVAYRDRGDDYVTKVVDLSSDLDSVYATLMDFAADGGGDGPESVNKALYDAVHAMSWSEQSEGYQAIFLVGDAPPHMDYNEVQYPEIIASAMNMGIVINTIQCGDIATTIAPWTQIAQLSRGEYFQVAQAGGAVAFTTPYDKEIAELSADLDSTRLYYGSEAEREKMNKKIAATDKIHSGLSVSSRARRAEFNASEAGKANLLGDKELVSDITEGSVALEELEDDALPEPLKAMSPAEQKDYVSQLSEKRAALQLRIRGLSKQR
ncbi:MAG: vWA domain-containing protein, partial [Pseudomonadota bacterium]